MPLIENLKGAATVDAAGGTYTFSLDEHGRYTARVTNMLAVQCFTGSGDRYRVVPDHPLELDDSKPAKAIAPASGKSADKTEDPAKTPAPKKLTAKQAKALADAEAKAQADADAEALKKAEEEAAAKEAAGNGNENAGAGDGSTENQKQDD